MTASSLWDSDNAGTSEPQESFSRMQNIVGRPGTEDPSDGKPAAVTDKTAAPNGSQSEASDSGNVDESVRDAAGQPTTSAADPPVLSTDDAPIER